MKTRLTEDGITWRPFLAARERTLRFDDIVRVHAAEGTVEGRGGERLRVGDALAARLADALRGPSASATAAEEGAAWDAFLGEPHGPLLAARQLLEAAERHGASDLHVEPASGTAIVRLRIDGDLVPFCRAPLAATQRIAAALKGMAGCLPYRADIVQEGRIARDGVAADVRASFVPTALGERVALRLFGRLRRLEELGLDESVLAAFRTALDRPHGLLLVAGATGAGKTTTLYAALDHVSRTRRGAHVSLEDPVEQRLRTAGIAVDQIELDPARGFDGEAALSAILRQDVDVVCVGELRTPAEARLAVHAAHTGRLVLAGVHAGTAAEARARMLDLGVDATLLGTTLHAVLHQSLLAGKGGARRLQSQFGQTLIELMIVVAIIGITLVASASGVYHLRLASEEAARERALQCLEYEAASLAAGRAPDPETRARLLELLPGGSLERRAVGNGGWTLTVGWNSQSGRRTRALTVAGAAL